MYFTGLIITLLIGGLIATVASSNDDILCYLQNLEDKLDKLEDKMESKLDTLQKQSCSTTKVDGKTDHDTSDDGKTDHDSSDDGKTDHDSSDGNVVKAKRIRDPFTLGNTPKKTITGLGGLWGMYIADDGIAYIVDGGSKITKLDSNGNKLKEITVDKGPLGIHVKGNKVFVALGGEIGIFTRDLTKVGRISSGYNFAIAVAVDSDDKIYTAGTDGTMHVYNKDGSKSHKIDLTKKNGIMFAIRFDANENIYTSIFQSSSLLVYTKAGVVNEFTVNGISGNPFVDDNGNIYVPGGHASPGLIYILNSSGSIIKRFQTPVKKKGALRDAIIGPDGTLWVLDAMGTIYLY